jgi:hypothetical protein
MMQHQKIEKKLEKTRVNKKKKKMKKKRVRIGK